MSACRMLPSERLDVDVEVRVGGDWFPGVLEHRRQSGERWQGFVRWSADVGETRLDWLDYDDIRQVDQ